MEAPLGSTAAAPVLVRYRNRALGEAELSFIREQIRSDTSRTRPQLARAICTAWEWRQPNGSLSEYACRDLLLRLQEWGHIELPPPRRAPPRRHDLPLLPAELIPLPWIEVRDPQCLDGLVVRPIRPEERQGWRLFMGRYHYLGDKPIVGEHLLYAAWLDGELVSLVGWASAALRVPLREELIGWDEPTKLRNLHLVTNNVRFLVFPWVRVKHLASKVLGRTLRRLSADWQARWGHPILLAETFVDPARFRGTCYRAANWRLLGMSAGRVRRANRYLRGGTPKAVYVYELRRDSRRLLRERSDLGHEQRRPRSAPGGPGVRRDQAG